MRENKFKGKDIETKEWVFGYYLYIKEQDKHYILTGKLKAYPVDTVHPYIVTEGFEWIEIDPDTVGQYTGLKDKNDTEIYEGDIVASCGRRDLPCVVEYNQDKCEFIMRYDGDGILHLVKEFKFSYEVIGNIYDNPELLED